MQPGYAGTITNVQIVLNAPKNPYLKSGVLPWRQANFHFV